MLVHLSDAVSSTKHKRGRPSGKGEWGVMLKEPAPRNNSIRPVLRIAWLPSIATRRLYSLTKTQNGLKAFSVPSSCAALVGVHTPTQVPSAQGSLPLRLLRPAEQLETRPTTLCAALSCYAPSSSLQPDLAPPLPQDRPRQRC